jgi:aminotransferase
MAERSVYESVGKGESTAGIAARVAQITVSAIKQMPVLAAEVGGCVSLGQGIPSFNTPRFIREAVSAELLNDESKIGKYSLQPGLPELKEEVARDLKRTRGLDVDPASELFISCGGMEALAAGLATVIERGDEVILPTPTYASHIEQILFAEGTPVFVPLLEEGGWKMDIEAMRLAVTGKTKAIVLCNPINPTGTVFAEEELRAIADLVIERDLFVITDEAYDFLVYDGLPYFSLLSIPELKERIIGACSFSKRYCMTGWRVGYMYACRRVIEQVLKVHDAFAICAPTVSQYAALAALRATNGRDGAGDESVRQLREALARRRDLVCRRLDKLASAFSYVRPSGGYYVFPRLRSGAKSMDYAIRLLQQAKVITIPGAAFGPAGEGHIRMSFGAADLELEEAFDRLDRFVAAAGG